MVLTLFVLFPKFIKPVAARGDKDVISARSFEGQGCPELARIMAVEAYRRTDGPDSGRRPANRNRSSSLWMGKKANE
jgi:hypothetical protein